MVKLAPYAMISLAVHSAFAQESSKPPTLTELGQQLDARSPHLLQQLWNTQRQIKASCPATERTGSEGLGSPQTRREQLLRESQVICETAQANLSECQRIVKAPAFRPQLFAFAAYPKEFAELGRAHDLRYLFGPFLGKAECEKHERLFQDVGVETLTCGPWPYYN